MAGELELGVHCSTFQPKPFRDPMISCPTSSSSPASMPDMCSGSHVDGWSSAGLEPHVLMGVTPEPQRQKYPQEGLLWKCYSCWRALQCFRNPHSLELSTRRLSLGGLENTLVKAYWWDGSATSALLKWDQGQNGAMQAGAASWLGQFMAFTFMGTWGRGRKSVSIDAGSGNLLCNRMGLSVIHCTAEKNRTSSFLLIQNKWSSLQTGVGGMFCFVSWTFWQFPYLFSSGLILVLFAKQRVWRGCRQSYLNKSSPPSTKQSPHPTCVDSNEMDKNCLPGKKTITPTCLILKQMEFISAAYIQKKKEMYQT